MSVKVSFELWREIMTEGNLIVARCTKGLPPGAAFIQSYYDNRHNIVVFVFEHSSFPEVPEGDVVSMPVMDVEYTRLQHYELAGFPTEADG